MKNSLQFLTDLKNNDNQAWFIDHSDEYEAARTETLEFAYLLLTQLSLIDEKLDPETEVDRFISTVINVVPKKAVKYFHFFDVSISPLANDGNEPSYLIHIEPNQSYISIKYDPDVFGLQVMRNYLSKNISLFETILDDCYSSSFMLEESSMLPTLPKGYPRDTPGESFIRLKKYELRSPIDLLKEKDELIRDILVTFTAALPFVQFFRRGLRL